MFANPLNLESSSEDPNHLQQNYIMGFVFTDKHENLSLSISDDWYEDLKDVYETLTEEQSVHESDMQIDNRYIITETNGD